MKPKNIKITKNNTNFNISPLSIHLDWFTKRYKNWEPQTFKILDDFINPNKSFIDIGAHIGLVLLYGADKAKKVLGVECDHVTFDSLKKNVSCNNFKDGVVLDHSALSNHSGTILIGKGKRGAEWGGSGIAFTDSSDVSAKEVKAKTIYDLIKEHKIDDCGFIKIDIEGAEALVLNNMKDFFENQKPTLYISIHPHLMNALDLQNTILNMFNIFPYVYDINYNLLERKQTCNLFLMNKIKIDQKLMSGSNGHELIGTFDIIE